MANREQIENWNRVQGPVWVANQERLDAQIQAHGEVALAAAAPQEGDRILDVGCGCGATTLALAAKVGATGAVTGLDVSRPMLERARQRAAERGLLQVDFLEGDAQTLSLAAGHYDAVTSRFGVMFFEDPVAAFANLGRSLKPGGRLAFVCWRAPQLNPWVTVPVAAVARHVALPEPPDPEAPGMFSFADAGRVTRILEAAGFGAVDLAPVTLSVAPGGGDLDEAVDFFSEVGPVASLLREAQAQGGDPALGPKVRVAIREALEPYVTSEGLGLDSSIWCVEARRPG